MRHSCVSPSPVRFSSLSQSKQQFLLLAQSLHFGQVRDLRIRAGDLVTSPPPRIIRRVKIGAQKSARTPLDAANSIIKQEWIEFFDELETIRDGVFPVIEIAHGLPFLYEIEQTVSI